MNKCLNENHKKSQMNKIIKRIQDTKTEFNKKIDSQKKRQTEIKLQMKAQAVKQKAQGKASPTD